jgi:hypothetical protein
MLKKRKHTKNVVGDADPETGINEMKTATVKMTKNVDINDAHDVCGHKGEALLRKTNKHIGVELTATLKPCAGYGYAKAKAKAGSKTTSRSESN